MLESDEIDPVEPLLLRSRVFGKLGRPYEAVEDVERASEKRKNFEVSY